MSSSGDLLYSPPVSYWSGVSREWRERDFTRPSRCPRCDKDVFFIRHNGGSVWVDPPLGPPWDKHGCFDTPSEPTHVFSTWSAKSSSFTNPKLGIIKRIQSVPLYAEPVLEIELTNTMLVSVILRWTPHDSALVGALVFVSEEDGLLLHQKYAEIPFHSFTRLHRAGTVGWYTCPRCKVSVRHGTGHEEYCRKNHGKIKATTAKPTPPPPPKLSQCRKPEPSRPHKSPITVYSARPTHRLIRRTIPQSPLPPPTAPKRETLEGRIGQAIAHVAQQAWDGLAGVQPPEEQLRQAKHQALALIAMLSPSIKRQVGNAFTSQKWQPLLSRRPQS